MSSANISELVGKVIVSIKGEKGDDRVEIKTADGCFYALYHEQDCCESVSIEDVVGDLSDLVGPRSPILEAEEVTSNDNPEGVKPPEYSDDSFTWTFYKLRTRKGGVTIRWYGSSNGYYSERVEFVRLAGPAGGATSTGRDTK